MTTSPGFSRGRRRHIQRVVRSDQVWEAAAIVAEAFEPLRSSEWLVPDPDQRRAVLAAVSTITITHALDYGHVDLVTQVVEAPDGTVGRVAVAAAVWFHNEKPSPPPPNYDRRLWQAAGVFTGRFVRRDGLFEAHRPDEPHHHLALLAVRPEFQGTRIGTGLLQHHHARLASQRLPAYAEAADLRSRRLGTAHGYRSRGDAFALPNGAQCYPMWREPGVDAGWPGLESLHPR